jgi:hypothetical protein
MYIEIYNIKDSLIKTLPAGKRKGINRVEWELLMEPPKVPSSVQLLGQAMTGPTFPPGEYKIKIIKGENSYEGRLKITWEPSPRHSLADRDLRHTKLMEAYDMLEELAFIDRQITDIRDKAKAMAALSVKKSTKKSLEELAVRMDTWHAEISPIKEGRITGEERLRERLGNVYSGIMNYQGRPTDSQLERLEVLKVDISHYAEQVKEVVSNDLVTINSKLEKEGLNPIGVISLEEFIKEK